MSETEKKTTTREINTFELPEKLAELTGVKEVGLVTLTADEELLCYKKSRGDNAKLSSELAKACLVESTANDGTVKKLAAHDGTVDSYWKHCEPKLRQLVLQAYADLHAVESEDTESFLKSRKLRVG